MSIFDRTRYLKTLFMLLPTGIILLYFGIKDISTGVEDLSYNKGMVDTFYIGKKYFDDCDCRMETFFIYFIGKKKPYVTTIKLHIDTLKATIKKGEQIEIWMMQEDKLNEIEQIRINGEMIIPYNKLYGFNIIIILIGIGLTLLSLFYIFKSPEDLLGGVEEAKDAEQEKEKKKIPPPDTSKYDKYMGI